MLRLRVLLLILVTIFAAHSLPAQTAPPANTSSQTETQPPPPAKPAYSLPPDKLKQAIEYSRIRVVLYFLETGWGILQLILLLALGIAARMRNFAVNISKNPWAQGFTFTFLLLFITSLLNLPLDMVGHHVSIAFGQSVQH